MMQTRETPDTQHNAPIDSLRNLWERFAIFFLHSFLLYKGPKIIAAKIKTIAARKKFFAARKKIFAARKKLGIIYVLTLLCPPGFAESLGREGRRYNKDFPLFIEI